MHTTNPSNKKSPPKGDDGPRIDAELTPLQTRIVRALARDGPCRFKTLVETTEPTMEGALSQSLNALQAQQLVRQSTARTWPRYHLSESGRMIVAREARRWVGAANALTEGER
jgi:DNA-binding HxlR family transcriptional regulator